MTAGYQCPRCGSKRVSIGYPNMHCFDCGNTEPLVDYPISWDTHRRYCREYGVLDPGPNEPPEHTVEELYERLAALEEQFQLLDTVDQPEKPEHQVDRSLIESGQVKRFTGGITL